MLHCIHCICMTSRDTDPDFETPSTSTLRLTIEYLEMFARHFAAGVHPVFTRQFGAHTGGFFSASRVLFQSSRSNHRGITTDVISAVRYNARSQRSSLPFLLTATGVAGTVGLGLSAFTRPTIHCDGESCRCYSFGRPLLILHLYQSP